MSFVPPVQAAPPVDSPPGAPQLAPTPPAGPGAPPAQSLAQSVGGAPGPGTGPEFIEFEGDRIPAEDVRQVRAFYRWAIENPTLYQDLTALSSGRAQIVPVQVPVVDAPGNAPGVDQRLAPAATRPQGPASRGAGPQAPDDTDPLASEVAALRGDLASLRSDNARIRAASARQIAIEAVQRAQSRFNISATDANSLLQYAADQQLIANRSAHHGGSNLALAMDEAMDFAYRIRHPERAAGPSTTRQQAHRMIGGAPTSGASARSPVPTPQNLSPMDRDKAMRMEAAAAMGLDPEAYSY